MLKSLLHRVLITAGLAVIVGCSVARPVNFASQRTAQNLIDKGIVLLESGKLSEAESSFWLALETSPEPGAYDGLGCVAFLKGQKVEAERIFRKLMSVFPEYNAARVNLALVMDSIGHKEEAVALYREALRRDPLNYKARNNLGAVLVSMDTSRDTKFGRQYLVDSDVISPNALARRNLEVLNREMSNYEQD